MSLADEINNELLRQRRLGYSTIHDDAHMVGELFDAAMCYFATGSGAAHRLKSDGVIHGWPFEKRSWKPRSQREDLIRSGALFLAEKARLFHMHQDSRAAYRACV